MKIIIPASGLGQRFKDAGYIQYKPLILVNDLERIIDFVIKCFDKNDEYFFISSPQTYELLEFHLRTLPNLNYKHFTYSGPKLGPTGAVLGTYDHLKEYISSDDNVIVSYCDYGMKWDYKDFLEFAKESDADGIIPCYSGYHPHLENVNNVYAACKVDDTGRVYSVIEKHRSENRLTEKWSAGLYYFSKFSTMCVAFAKLVSSGNKLNGEYYVSLAYNEIVDDYTVITYDGISKFYQFGTPEDFEYAKNKLSMLEHLDNDRTSITNTVILSAGKGERFLNLGFKQPKPFIPLGDSDFITRIAESFDKVDTKITYVGSREHEHFWNGYNVNFVDPNKIGAAYSYVQSCASIIGETLIVPCDLITKYTTPRFLQLKLTSDVIIFTTDPTEYAKTHKTSFAWVTPDDNNSIADISIKELNAQLSNQMVLIGSFWVRENSILLDSIFEIFEKDFKTNGEYYLDNAFKLMLSKHLTVKYVKLDKYFSLGTYEEYTENGYWLTV